MYFVYVLRCVDSSLYCGYTTDLSHRIKAHSGGVKGGAKYTKSRPPVMIEAVWICPSKGCAMSLEASFKKLTRQEKETVVKGSASPAQAFPNAKDIENVVRSTELEGAIPARQ